MRAIQITEPKRLDWCDPAHPGDPGLGEALVRSHRMGICGTDVSSYLGKFPFFAYPRIPGHELGVEVVAVGSGVTEVRVGDRCSVEPYLSCGTCYACRKGQTNCCEALNVIGVMSDGGLCEEFLVPARNLHPSTSLSFEQLALVETLAIGCHGTSRVDPGPEDQVLIIGAGPIGLSMLEFTRLTGAKVTVMDLQESRLQFCQETYGVEGTILFGEEEQALEDARKITGGDRFSIVCDATGHAGSMARALRYVAHTGILLYLGVTSDEVRFPHPLLHKPEMTIKGSRNAVAADFRRIILLVEEGTVNTDPWITHRIGFEEVIEGFESLTRPETGVLKAMIEVR
ncbi:MAG: zinc-binding alcohol dehydrogenase family protein [Verrucomicrobiota bacterium]